VLVSRAFDSTRESLRVPSQRARTMSWMLGKAFRRAPSASGPISLAAVEVVGVLTRDGLEVWNPDAIPWTWGTRADFVQRVAGGVQNAAHLESGFFGNDRGFEQRVLLRRTRRRLIVDRLSTHCCPVGSQSPPWLCGEDVGSGMKERLALPDENSARFLSRVEIACGTLHLAGQVAPNFGRPGGGRQIYIDSSAPTRIVGSLRFSDRTGLVDGRRWLSNRGPSVGRLLTRGYATQLAWLIDELASTRRWPTAMERARL
jgi:hypothetical protein